MTQRGPVQKRSIANRLLAALPAKDYERLVPRMEEVTLKIKSTIYESGDAIGYVYFPTSGVVSLLAVIEERLTVDIGMVGSEGMIGLSLFLGETTTLGRAIVQGNGGAFRIAAADFKNVCGKNGALSRLLLRYARSMLVQISQSAACYRFHTVEQRLARRLLMMSDRMCSNALQMTHDLLSKMLGVRREAVTLASGSLQKSGLITNGRGSLLIIDRRGLEAAACSCYAMIRDDEESPPV